MTFRVNTLRGRLLISLVGPVLACALTWQALSASDQESKKESSSEAVALGYRGTASCDACHTDAHTYGPGGRDDRGDWIRGNEMAIWSNDDIHSQAFQLLKESPITERMAKGLGKTKEQLLSDQACLNCHFPFSDNIRNSPTVSPIPEGVNCEACHGPAEKWIGPHSELDWRRKSPSDKRSLGMRDMSHAIDQAELCLSCHVGQKSKSPFENRFVTHEMYAAGHPPLPSVEVATFSNVLPHHWRYSDEKQAAFTQWFDQFKAKRLNDPRISDANDWQNKYWPAASKMGDRSRTKLAVLGSVVAIRKTMEWLGNESIEAETWPHLEYYDCQACHHELRVSEKSWRQKRSSATGKPGRPMLRRWPEIGIELAQTYAQADAKGEQVPNVTAELQRLDQLFGAKPFGNPADITPVAHDVEQKCDGLLKILDGLSYGQADAIRLFKLLAELSARDGRLLDYDSARQVGWTLRIFWEDADGKITSDSTKNDALKKELDEIDRLVDLSLPGRKRTEESRQQIGLPYSVVSNYDAEEFARRLGEINGLLSDKPTAAR